MPGPSPYADLLTTSAPRRGHFARNVLDIARGTARFLDNRSRGVDRQFLRVRNEVNQKPKRCDVRDCAVNSVSARCAGLWFSGEGAVMTTLDAVSAKKKLEPSAEETAAKELVRQARAQGISLNAPDGLLKHLTKNVLEAALNEEMTEHLAHEKNRAEDGRESSNVRNGTRPKTVLTEATGHVQLDVPRDRDGSFDPVIAEVAAAAAERGRRDRAVAVCARVDVRGDLRALRADLWGVGVEGDGLADHRQGGRGDDRGGQRPLDGVCAAVFIDAIMVKVRDGQVANRPIYAAIGVSLAGDKDVLVLWAGTGGEGAKFWMSVLTDLKNRGINDVFFLVCDGLKGLPGGG
jgi:putative transposase